MEMVQKSSVRPVRDTSHASTGRVGQLNNLQILRAVAAINVVIFHTLGVAELSGLPAPVFKYLAGWGENGVDLFFVISGFVISLSQYETPRKPSAFLRNRIVRIVPNYWAWTLILFSATLVLPSLFSRLSADPVHLLVSLFFTSQPLTGESPFFYVGWTLEYEALFYLLFWATLLTGFSWAPIVLMPLVLIILMLVCSLPLLALEFFFGMLIARAFIKKSSIINPGVSLVLGVFGLLSTLVIDPVGDRVVYWGIPSALIVHGAVFLSQIRSKFLGFLGAASYSIYLVQVIAIPGVFKVLVALIPYVNPDIAVVLVTMISILVGCAAYMCLERPLLRYMR